MPWVTTRYSQLSNESPDARVACWQGLESLTVGCGDTDVETPDLGASVAFSDAWAPETYLRSRVAASRNLGPVASR